MQYDDIMRLSRGTANPQIVRLAVENAADSLHWLLDHGFKTLPEYPVISFEHEPYSVPRTYWGEHGGLSVMSAITPQYEAETAAGGIETWLETELVRITLNDSDSVTGVVVKHEGAEITVSADALILATGGYTANAALFPELCAGKILHGGGYRHGKGAGLKAAVEVDAEIINTDKFLPGFAGVQDPEPNGGFTASTITIPQERQPWELYLDIRGSRFAVRGSRFMREDDPSADSRKRALLDQPDMTFWVVHDEAVLRSAPAFFTTPPDIVAARFGNLPGYRSADTLAELAALTGMGEATPQSSIDTYNEGVATGTADPMGRVHLPRHHGAAGRPKYD